MNSFREFNDFLSTRQNKKMKLSLIKFNKNERHHHHHHDFSEKSKREERIENEDKKVSSSSEYHRELEDARVAA
jgi:hypothetical protein